MMAADGAAPATGGQLGVVWDSMSATVARGSATWMISRAGYDTFERQLCMTWD